MFLRIMNEQIYNLGKITGKTKQTSKYQNDESFYNNIFFHLRSFFSYKKRRKSNETSYRGSQYFTDRVNNANPKYFIEH